MNDFLAHLFVPRPSNNHRSKLLHSHILLFLTLGLVGFQVILGFVAQKGKILGYAANISAQEVIRLVNEKRQNIGLSAVVENPTLSRAAYAKGTDMLSKDYWAHVAPDGTQPWKFFIDAGYTYRYAGENLARDFSSASSAVDAWMASPSHRDNMLSPKYKEIGIGVVEGSLAGTDTTIIVQFFGTKLGDGLPVQPVAKATEKQNAAPAATSTPAPTVAPIIAEVKAEENLNSVSNSPQVSPFNVTRVISLVLIFVLAIALVIDTLIIESKKLTRYAGRPYAHFAFLGMIIVIVIIAKAGQII